MGVSKDLAKPKIVPVPNGPFHLISSQTPERVEYLQNSKRELATTVRKVSLCRCGASNNKPFCDGTHLSIKFKDEKN